MPADRPDTSDLGQNLTRRGARQRRRPNQGPRMADVPERRLGRGSSGRAERRSRTVLDGDSVLDPVGAITRITGVLGQLQIRMICVRQRLTSRAPSGQ